MSELVLRAFAAHLKKSGGTKIQYGYQKGGLAMATAAVSTSHFPCILMTDDEGRPRLNEDSSWSNLGTSTRRKMRVRKRRVPKRSRAKARRRRILYLGLPMLCGERRSVDGQSLLAV